MKIPRWKLRYGWDGPLFYDAINHKVELKDNCTVVRASDYDEAVKIIRMIAEMPASTHEIDRELCREWLAENEVGP